MKQPEDTKTIDLLDQVKRGRGRPRVEQPLTPAERARRYRENQAKKKALMRTIRDDESDTEIPSYQAEQLGSVNDDLRLENQNLHRENLRLRLELGKRDADTVTQSSDQVFMLEMKIQQLEADLQSYRDFHEQRVEQDREEQRQYQELWIKAEKLRRQNEDLAGMVEMFIDCKMKKKGMPADVFRSLVDSYQLSVSSQ